VVFWKHHVWGLGFITPKISQKISQSLVRIQTQTRSQRLCEGTRLRRLTKDRQPSSQCPTGADCPHTVPDTVPTSNWCECERDDRQAVHRACSSFLSGTPTLYRPVMFTYRCRRGQEHDLEGQSLEGRAGLEDCVDPDMHIRFHTLCVKIPRFTIVHITVEVVSTCLARNPHLLILKLHNHSRRSPR
jgi:hypothetical protein